MLKPHHKGAKHCLHSNPDVANSKVKRMPFLSDNFLSDLDVGFGGDAEVCRILPHSLVMC